MTRLRNPQRENWDDLNLNSHIVSNQVGCPINWLLETNSTAGKQFVSNDLYGTHFATHCESKDGMLSHKYCNSCLF